MKARFTNQRKQALTLPELLVVIAVLMVLVILLLPVLAAAKRRASQISCRSQLRQVTLCLEMWTDDHNHQYPMAVSVADGGGKELIADGKLADFFRVTSNELSTPKILVCPQDTNVVFSPYDFGPDFSNSNISYFVGVDIMNKDSPQRILTGDDNLVVDGVAIKSGVRAVAATASTSWDSNRHIDVYQPHFWNRVQKTSYGWLGFADGSVTEAYNDDLQHAIQQTGMATNRLAIP